MGSRANAVLPGEANEAVGPMVAGCGPVQQHCEERPLMADHPKWGSLLPIKIVKAPGSPFPLEVSVPVAEEQVPEFFSPSMCQSHLPIIMPSS